MALNPPPNANGWNNGPVTAHFTCTDPISGIATCPPDQTIAAEGANQTVTGSATNRAGNNPASATVTVNIDKTPPTIAAVATPPANASGWNRTDVTVSFTCNDALSGIASCPPPTTVSAETAGQTITGTATDQAGNTATASALLKIDKTPPVVTITSPAPGATLVASPASLSGTAIDALSGITSATCNGVATTVGAGGAVSCAPAIAGGPDTLTLTATDAAGNVASAQVPVTLSSKPVITSQPTTTAHDGVPYQYQVLAADPDGDPLTYSLSQSPAGMSISTGGLVTWTPSGSELGSQPVSIVVDDGRSGPATQSFQVTVSDITPPFIALSGPSKVLAGAQVTITAQANDDVAVDRVTFTINGGAPTVDVSQPYQQQFTVPQDAVAGTLFHVIGTARDTSGNSTSAEIVVAVTAQPDTQPPSVTLNAPAQASPGATINLSASATDNVGVASVTFSLAAASAIATDTDKPYGATFTVPSDAAAGSSLVFVAQATDFSGNTARDTKTVAIVTAADTTPPVVKLSVPAMVTQGNPLPVSATVTSSVGVSRVDFLVNGVVVASETDPPFQTTFDVAPSFPTDTPLNVVAHAIDLFGSDASDSALVGVTSGSTNHDPVGNAGGPYSGQTNAAITFDGRGSTDPDNDQLSYAWDFGDGTKGSGATPVHVYASAGTFVVLLAVDDGRGGTDTASTSASIQAAPDLIPPVITLKGPSQALPGTQVTMTALASDNVGVTGVRFAINGTADPADLTTSPFQRIVNIPPVAAPGDTIAVRATARDAAGNTAFADAVLTIASQPDTEKPTVTLRVPPQATPGTSVLLAADATDNVGVASVAFLANGTSIGSISAPPYQLLYPVPASTSPGSIVNVVAQAFDYAGNEADASGNVTIVSVATTTPPSVSLTVPAQVTAGTQLALSAVASDNVGIANVSFLVSGETIATLTAPPYQAQFSVPAGAAGAVLRVDVHAVNFSGLQSTDTGETQVVSQTPIGQGTLTGLVYDDTTGLPLPGANVVLAGKDARGNAYSQSATTDSAGRYALNANQGQAVAQITGSGWTRVDRPVSITSGQQATEIIDARLTPVGSGAHAFSAVLGGSFSASGTTLGVPPGALQTDATLAVTPLTQQGIEGLLPPGWTPVGAVDIAPHGSTFGGGASLLTPNTFKLPQTTSLVVAAWDEQASGWRAVATSSTGGDGTTLQATVPGSGEYAWILADQQPAVPPAPQPGDLVAGSTSGAIPGDATAVVDPQPKILFFQPGVHSNVQGQVTTAAPIASGAIVLSTITEGYTFLSGAQIHVEPYVEDLIFYQTPGTPTVLAAGYPVTPSMTFDPLSLDQGVISVELDTAGVNSQQVPTIGPSGGTVTTTTGESVQLGAGAVASTTPIVIQQMSLGATGLTLPAGLTFIDGAVVSFTGALGAPITLAVPQPAQVSANSQVLLVREQELAGQTQLVLVGLGKVAGGQIVSDTSLGGAAGVFEGPLVPGRYLFLLATTDIGFITGTVTGVDGKPFSGALVSVNTLSVVALSHQSGTYVEAAATGAVTATALDVVKTDSGTAPGAIGNRGDVIQLALQLSSSVPAVTSITPTDGSTNFPLTNPIVATFSKGIDPSTVSGLNATNATLTDSTGTAVPGTVILSSNNTVLTFRASATLQSNASYVFTLGTGISDLSGHSLPSPVVVRFVSLNTSAPPPPPAGNITASIPNASGQTTITATGGTADPHNTVTIVDVTTGASTPVLVGPNGGFTVTLAAAVTDKLQVQIQGAAGNPTIVPLPRFTQTNADGSVSAVIDAGGGHIDGPGGIAVDVPIGAFAQGTVVTVNPVAEADFPVPLGDAAKTVFGYAGGISLDTQGAVPTKEINVSIAPGPTDQATDQWVVDQVITVNGRQELQVVDTAKLVNGRITTASPPCPGVTGAGVYGVHKSSQSVGINWAQMQPLGGSLQLTYDSTLGALGFPFPFLAFAPDVPQTVCFPVLTGRVSVQQNTLALTVTGDQVAPNVREIVVTDTNPASGGEFHFPINAIQPTFTINGNLTDQYQIVANGSNGSQAISNSAAVTFFTVAPGPIGQVIVTLDPDKISTAASSYVIKDLTQGQTNTFNQQLAPVTLKVAGGASDTFVVKAVPVQGPAFALTSTTTPPAPPLDTGNLIVRALAGTIDPDRAQINAYNAAHPGAPLTGAAVTQITLTNGTTNQNTDIPLSLIEAGNGGFQMAFNGNFTDQYSLSVFYEDGKQVGISMPTFRVIVKNALTGRVIKTITGPAPLPGEPLNLGTIKDTGQAPVIISGPSRFDNVDPSAPLSFRFSEPLDPSTLTTSNLILERQNQDLSWAPVASTIQITEGQTVATIVPSSALGLGQTYRIRFAGVMSSAGRPLVAQTLTFSSFTPKRICPTTSSCDISFQVFAAGNPIPFKDLDIVRKGSAAGTSGGAATIPLTTNLAVITASQSFGNEPKLLTLDVTDPTQVKELGFDTGVPSRQRVKVIQNASFQLHDVGGCPTAGTSFTGDVAIVTTFNTYYSILSFWNVTNLSQPCLLGQKLLTATPDTLAPYSTHGTVHALGFAKGLATLTSTTAPIAYAAVSQVGLMAADLGVDIPERTPDHTAPVDDIRIQENLFSGDYVDVVAVNDRLVAIENTQRTLDVFDANLSHLASLQLTDAPRRIAYVQGYPVDLNHDGQITPDELRNVAFVAGDTTIQFVDLTDPASPQALGYITMPGITRELDVDPGKQKLYAGGSDEKGGDEFYIIDGSNLTLSGLITQGKNPRGWDDRIIWSNPYGGVAGFRIDAGRGLAYISSARGLDIFALTDTCCDLAVDLAAQRVEPPVGDPNDLFVAEKKALQTRIGLGIAQAAVGSVDSLGKAIPACAGVSGLLAQNKLWMLEQGSGACVWKGTCGDSAGYQPGVSDHDYELFFPATLIQSHTTNPADPIECTQKALKDQFFDSDNDPKEIIVDGKSFVFADITFYPVNGDGFQAAKLDISSIPGQGADASGDMGLGRQQLLLKWVTEGAYVDIPQYSLRGPSFADILTRMRDQKFPSPGIPALEGFEWAKLQEYALVKSKALLRVKGASDQSSALHSLYINQVHGAAKAGIRAALARMVADAPPVSGPGGPDGLYHANPDLLKEGQYDACMTVTSDPPAAWPTKACASFEEFVASMAARAYLQATSFNQIPLFTLPVVQQIARFYRIKADLESVVSETDADTFILSVYNFITGVTGVQNSTQPIYDSTLDADPDKALRKTNMSTVNASLLKAYTHGSVHVIPHASNAGFRNADLVAVRMYRMDGPTTAGSGTFVNETAISLPSSSERFLDFSSDSTCDPDTNQAANEENALGLSQEDAAKAAKHKQIFELGDSCPAPAANNPLIDFTTGFGVPHAVVFTIDLPEASSSVPGKTQKEANRQNNLGGFFYYVLDRTTPGPTPPSTPGAVPLPIPDPNGDVLKPDAQCDVTPILTMMQSANPDKILVTVFNNSSQTITSVQACSDVALACSAPITLAPNSGQTITINITSPVAATSAESHVTVSGIDQSGNNVQLVSNQQIVNTLSPITIQMYDSSPLADLDHPFSRYLINRVPGTVQPKPIRGATTDGGDKTVRIEVQGLQANAPLEAFISDFDNDEVTDGVGQIVAGQASGVDVTFTADSSGNAELFYTPPSYFLRPSQQKFDFGRSSRQVMLSVHQENIGTGQTTITLRRPPVFLLHGLGGNLDAFDNFQPLVPGSPWTTLQNVGKAISLGAYTPANPTYPVTYLSPRPGFEIPEGDAAFDLFNVGSVSTSGHVADEASVVQDQIKLSLSANNYLQGYAVGKIDLIAHSMGGLISRRMIDGSTRIQAAVRKLIIMNSPLLGTPLADQIVATRDQDIVNLGKISSNPVDLWSPTPTDLTNTDVNGAIKVNMCYTVLNFVGLTPRFNLFNGAVDDLQTTKAASTYLSGTYWVPTHHVVTSTTSLQNPLSGFSLQGDLGAFGEVNFLWGLLGSLCNWTPDSNTVDTTKLKQTESEIIKVILTFGLGEAGILSKPASTADGILKGLKKVFSSGWNAGFGDPPVQIFSGPNDRIVPVTSQLEGLTFTDPTVTSIHGYTDHQAAKISPGVPASQCIDTSTGVPVLKTPPTPPDLPDSNGNADGTPDVVCHVVNLLEVDPKGKLFKQP